MSDCVALRERTRELVLADGALLEKHLLGRHAGPARRVDGLGGHGLVDEAELDEDVAQEAAPGAAQRRRADAWAGEASCDHGACNGLRAHASSSIESLVTGFAARADTSASSTASEAEPVSASP